MKLLKCFCAIIVEFIYIICCMIRQLVVNWYIIKEHGIIINNKVVIPIVSIGRTSEIYANVACVLPLISATWWFNRYNRITHN